MRYAALTTKGTTLTTTVASVAANEKVLQASIGARDLARAAFDLELSNYKTLVENLSTSAADVQSMGLIPMIITRASKAPPDPPGALVVKLGKVHGKARVAVQGNGYLGKFVAEVSTESHRDGHLVVPARHRQGAPPVGLPDRHQALGPLRRRALGDAERLVRARAGDHPLTALHPAASPSS